MRISDWSSDVCSSDLAKRDLRHVGRGERALLTSDHDRSSSNDLAINRLACKLPGTSLRRAKDCRIFIPPDDHVTMKFGVPCDPDDSHAGRAVPRVVAKIPYPNVVLAWNMTVVSSILLGEVEGLVPLSITSQIDRKSTRLNS